MDDKFTLNYIITCCIDFPKCPHFSCIDLISCHRCDYRWHTLCHLQILYSHPPTLLQSAALDGLLRKRLDDYRDNPHQVQTSAQPDRASREYGIAETYRQLWAKLDSTCSRLNSISVFGLSHKLVPKQVRRSCHPTVPILCSSNCL